MTTRCQSLAQVACCIDEGEVARLRHELRTLGWAMSRGPEGHTLANWMLQAAQCLGWQTFTQRGKHRIETITPLDELVARPRSLSATYGLNAFPFHVDTSHWSVPARYLMLGAPQYDESRRPTELLNRESIALTQEEVETLYQGLFLIRAGRVSFYASSALKGQPFLRLDPGCMQPLDAHAKRALRLFTKPAFANKIVEICWRAGSVLFIDNWRVLHRRGSTSSPYRPRTLLRIVAS